ncbi:MAG: phosphatidylserine decarboxylase family protein [Syntrophomonadaceae bacterium]|jgi:phosphatidylserine decarboxylase
MSHNSWIAKEGWSSIAFCVALTVITYILLPPLWATIPFVLTIFCTYFFRNPQRYPDETRGIIVAPADGRVMSIEKVVENNFLCCETIRVRIFLNIFNVHINRIPVAGTVERIEKTGGVNLPAFLSQAAEKNVRNHLILSTAWGKVLVVQITGLIARRIVCWVKPGDHLTTGERFGLIRFGSCTELYLPPDVQILIRAGQNIKGGETVIGKFCD